MPEISPQSSPVICFGLNGKVAIVTGGAQGIGEACARRFARERAKVVILDVDDGRGGSLATELGAQYMHCDVGDKLDVDAAVARTLKMHGHIDVLVNNAGIFRAADFLDVTEEDFDEVLRVNLKGSFLMGQAVARAMARGIPRRHRQHEFCQRRAGHSHHRQLQREQGWYQPAHPRDGAGAGRQGHPRQRRGTRHHRHPRWPKKRC